MWYYISNTLNKIHPNKYTLYFDVQYKSLVTNNGQNNHHKTHKMVLLKRLTTDDNKKANDKDFQNSS